MSRKGSFDRLDHSSDTEIGNEVFSLPRWKYLGVFDFGDHRHGLKDDQWHVRPHCTIVCYVV